MSVHHAPSSSSKPLWLLALLVACSFLVIAAARWGGWTQVGHDAPVVWTRALHFQDHSSGAVLVIDASTSREVARFEGEHSDGRLSLRDPTTDTRIPLDSFGPSQLALFQPLRRLPLVISSSSQGDTP